MKRASYYLVMAALVGCGEDEGQGDAWTDADSTVLPDMVDTVDATHPIDASPDADASSGPVWHWDDPLPQGSELLAVHGASAVDMWAVGADGSAIHWDGARWSLVPTSTRTTFTSVWVSAPDDVWAMGDYSSSWAYYEPLPRILHWNGRTWTESLPVPPGWKQTTGLWGSAPDDVWAVGNSSIDGAVIHWDGMSWSSVRPLGLQHAEGIWGAAGDDVWVVGFRDVDPAGSTRGDIWHWDGDAWTSYEGVTPEALTAVWGATHNDVWAVGKRGTVVRWDGQAWSRLEAGTRVDFEAVSGRSTNAVWAAGCDQAKEGCATVFWDGTRWTPAASPPGRTVKALWSAPSGETWAVGDGVLARQDAGGWEVMGAQVSPVSYASVAAIGGSGADDVWVLFRGGHAMHFDEAGWRAVPLPGDFETTALWSYSPELAWAVAHDGSILFWDGAAWTVQSWHLARLLGVWGSAPDDVWAVGASGTVLHWDGAAWTQLDTWPELVGDLGAMWGAAPDDVWAVYEDHVWGGDHLSLAHWDGVAWSPVAAGAGLHVTGIWGTSATDVWAVSGPSWADCSSAAHWNGGHWRIWDCHNPPPLRAVGGTGACDVWAISDTTVWRWDCKTWSEVPDVPSLGWTGIWGAPTSDLWFAGTRGILHRAP